MPTSRFRTLLRFILAAAFVHLAAAAYNSVHGLTAMHSWTTVPARVLSSEAIPIHGKAGGVVGGRMKADVRFDWQGAPRDAVLHIENYTRSSHYAQATRKLYAPGSTHQIFVNPRQPETVAANVGYNLATFGTTVTSLPIAVLLIQGVVWAWKNQEPICARRPPTGHLTGAVLLIVTFAVSLGVLIQRLE